MSLVKIFLADGFEEIEAITIIDILRRSGIDAATVSISDDLKVEGGHDILVLSDELFDDVSFDDVDMIVLPGGAVGTQNLKKHRGLSELIMRFNEENRFIAAICAAPTVLGSLGLLSGKRAVCYPGMENSLIDAEIGKNNVEVDGNIITSMGPGTAPEFSLKLVELLLSLDVANKLKADMILC